VTLTDDDWSSVLIAHYFEHTPNGAYEWERARFANVDVPEISAEVLEDGAVLTWLDTGFGQTNYQPLPVRFIRANNTPYTWSYHAQITEGRIRLLFMHERLDPAVTPPSPLTTVQPDRILRWVIIPPAVTLVAETLPVHLGAEATVRALVDHGFELSGP